MKFEAILFDCDGVLVDSEPIVNGVLRDMLEEAGWAMTLADCMATFVGKAVRDERALIAARTGRPLTDDWLSAFYERRNLALREGLAAIDGAHEAVAAAHARVDGRIACASGADRFKVEMQLAQVGLLPYFDGRVFSGHEMPRSKPAPDVYLAAADHLGVPGARCLVIDDTPETMLHVMAIPVANYLASEQQEVHATVTDLAIQYSEAYLEWPPGTPLPAGWNLEPWKLLVRWSAFAVQCAGEDEAREFAAVIEQHVGALAALEREQLAVDALVVFLFGLALPGEHRNAGLGDGGGGVILGRVDVAAGPGDLGAELDEGVDEHRGLHGHVQAAGDAGAAGKDERAARVPFDDAEPVSALGRNPQPQGAGRIQRVFVKSQAAQR